MEVLAQSGSEGRDADAVGHTQGKDRNGGEGSRDGEYGSGMEYCIDRYVRLAKASVNDTMRGTVSMQ